MLGVSVFGRDKVDIYVVMNRHAIPVTFQSVQAEWAFVGQR